jgi:hypothetical protein
MTNNVTAGKPAKPDKNKKLHLNANPNISISVHILQQTHGVQELYITVFAKIFRRYAQHKKKVFLLKMTEKVYYCL